MKASKTSYVYNAHPEYIDSLYKSFQEDPASVDHGWRKFFEGFEFAQGTNGKVSASGAISSQQLKEFDVVNLIEAYRTRGHLFTKTNPVRERRKYLPTLEVSNFNLADEDLDTVFQAGVAIGIGPASLRDIIEHLQVTYNESVGAEYMFIRSPDRLGWLQERMESSRNHPNFTPEEKRYILNKLNQAVVFENFLHSKYVGQKRFSLSGGETLIPALDSIIEKGSQLGVTEFVIGMAHRGRLNVLANILGKSYEDIFAEFQGAAFENALFAGDVKYHLGYSNSRTTLSGKQVHLSVVPNPSHLEAVNPVVEGVVRAKIDKRYGGDANKIVPIHIHGDAAIAAQGIVYEVAQMSQLEGYYTGGTIHLVINNQVGFTTNYLDGRSSTYCTDVAKVIQAPVFHVNGDDVEAVVHAIVMAMEYRQKFHSDVFIDILGYRKYGHNEADEPRFTQPKLYEAIAKHNDPRKIYYNELLKAGDIESGISQEMEREFQTQLQYRLEEAKEKDNTSAISAFKADWHGFRKPEDSDFEQSPATGVAEKDLRRIAEKIFVLPKNRKIFRKIQKLYKERQQRFEEGNNLDWAIGEALAYATILDQRFPVRLSGQDCERGTFSHRHAVLLDLDTEEEYIPLNKIHSDQGTFTVYNSLLSEYGVLGFEYGYASAHPKGLTLWEAQFGDFANGAQIIFDQFISCAEAKWKRYNGLVMLLPHGYEGQGPEHSSARIERYLTLCARNNMFIVNCTTPASFFHVLRRQVSVEYRIPLVIFTPKSLLRHPACVSPVQDFTDGRFQEVIDDPQADPQKVKRLLLCSGKIYYDLLERKQEKKHDDVAIIRLEQLYPLPQKQLKAITDRYKKAERFFWVQEEPENMGPWTFIRRKLKFIKTDLISRDESASPATGFHKYHQAEQNEIVDLAFNEKSELRTRVAFHDQDEI